MVLAILAILTPIVAAAAPMVGEWALRRFQKATTKAAEYEQAKHENGKVVAGDDVARLNALLEHRLNSVRPSDDSAKR